MVSDDAWVSGDAEVSGNAVVSDDAWVSGNTEVTDEAEIQNKHKEVLEKTETTEFLETLPSTVKEIVIGNIHYVRKSKTVTFWEAQG